MPNRRVLSVVLLSLSAAAAGCARQAIVTSEPGSGPTGGATATVGTNVLTADLERFAAAQSAYYDAHDAYASSLSDLGFTASRGVRLDVIQGDRNGFSGIARSGDAECAIFDGGVRSPRGYATSPGIPACRS
jgi:hypothetical protein